MEPTLVLVLTGPCGRVTESNEATDVEWTNHHERAEGTCSYDGLAVKNRARASMSCHPEAESWSVPRSSRCSQMTPLPYGCLSGQWLCAKTPPPLRRPVSVETRSVVDGGRRCNATPHAHDARPCAQTVCFEGEQMREGLVLESGPDFGARRASVYKFRYQIWRIDDLLTP
jgi:hypothetical protein